MGIAIIGPAIKMIGSLPAHSDGSFPTVPEYLAILSDDKYCTCYEALKTPNDIRYYVTGLLIEWQKLQGTEEYKLCGMIRYAELLINYFLYRHTQQIINQRLDIYNQQLELVGTYIKEYTAKSSELRAKLLELRQARSSSQLEPHKLQQLENDFKEFWDKSDEVFIRAEKHLGLMIKRPIPAVADSQAQPCAQQAEVIQRPGSPPDVIEKDIVDGFTVVAAKRAATIEFFNQAYSGSDERGVESARAKRSRVRLEASSQAVKGPGAL